MDNQWTNQKNKREARCGETYVPCIFESPMPPNLHFRCAFGDMMRPNLHFPSVFGSPMLPNLHFPCVFEGPMRPNLHWAFLETWCGQTYIELVVLKASMPPSLKFPNVFFGAFSPAGQLVAHTDVHRNWGRRPDRPGNAPRKKNGIRRPPPHSDHYAHIEVVVAFLVVNLLVFWT